MVFKLSYNDNILIFTLYHETLRTFKKHRNEILFRFSKRNKLSNLRVFGSVARGEDTEDSDIDFLVSTSPGTTLLDLGGLCADLEEFFGQNFDVIEENSLPTKFKETVLKEAIPL